MRAPFVLAPLLLAAMATTPAAAATPPPSPYVATYTALAALETRVAAIGFRLTTANARWCPALQPQFGWLWGDARLYDDARRADALAAYGATDSDAPFVAAIAPGSPAAAAGLRPGVSVAAVNGVAVPAGEGSDAFARIAALETWLATLPPDRPARFTTPDGTAVDVMPVPGCASDFRVDARDRPEGAADGRLVVVSAGLAVFAADDDELAAAIAHELAHNILRHRARLDAAGIDRGLLQDFGRNARLTRETEVEADRLSVWLLAGAGYDPAAAVRFWRRFGQRKGKPLFEGNTHPQWRDRAASIENEVRIIAAARAAGRLLEPPLIGAPPPLE